MIFLFQTPQKSGSVSNPASPAVTPGSTSVTPLMQGIKRKRQDEDSDSEPEPEDDVKYVVPICNKFRMVSSDHYEWFFVN